MKGISVTVKQTLSKEDMYSLYIRIGDKTIKAIITEEDLEEIGKRIMRCLGYEFESEEEE